MKRVLGVVAILFMLSAVMPTMLSAQSVEKLRTQLAVSTTEGDCVTVTEDSMAAEAIKAVDAMGKPSKVSGYRVVIYFSNGQGANDKARSVVNTFKNKYPHISAYLVYESPYFKVSVGDCLSMEEALILMNSFISDYPKAFPKREDIRLTELQNAKAMPRRSDDTVSSEAVASTEQPTTEQMATTEQPAAKLVAVEQPSALTNVELSISEPPTKPVLER